MRLFSMYLAIAPVLLLVSARASFADSKAIDKRNHSEEAAHYLIFACHEDSPAGHAFVVWGRESWEKKASELKAFGFYPREGGKGVLGPVPGEIVDDAINGSLAKATSMLIVRVNSDVYAKAEQIRAEWAKKDYELVESDCVTFLAAVAAKVPELKVPNRDLGSLEPATFLRKLLVIN